MKERPLIQIGLGVTKDEGIRVGDYHPSELLLVLLFGIIIGLRRINKTETLK